MIPTRDQTGDGTPPPPQQPTAAAPASPTQSTGLAEFVRARNPAGRPFAGIELTEFGFPADPSLGGIILAAGHVDPVAMAAAVDDYDRWGDAFESDWPTDPRTVVHLQVAVLDGPDGAGLTWASDAPGRVHPVTAVIGR